MGVHFSRALGTCLVLWRRRAGCSNCFIGSAPCLPSCPASGCAARALWERCSPASKAAEEAGFPCHYVCYVCEPEGWWQEGWYQFLRSTWGTRDIFAAAAGKVQHWGLYWLQLAQAIPSSFLGFLQWYLPNHKSRNNFSFTRTKVLS